MANPNSDQEKREDQRLTKDPKKRTLLDILRGLAMGDQPGAAHSAAQKALERERRRREMLEMEG